MTAENRRTGRAVRRWRDDGEPYVGSVVGGGDLPKTYEPTIAQETKDTIRAGLLKAAAS